MSTNSSDVLNNCIATSVCRELRSIQNARQDVCVSHSYVGNICKVKFDDGWFVGRIVLYADQENKLLCIFPAPHHDVWIDMSTSSTDVGVMCEELVLYRRSPVYKCVCTPAALSHLCPVKDDLLVYVERVYDHIAAEPTGEFVQDTDLSCFSRVTADNRFPTHVDALKVLDKIIIIRKRVYEGWKQFVNTVFMENSKISQLSSNQRSPVPHTDTMQHVSGAGVSATCVTPTTPSSEVYVSECTASSISTSLPEQRRRSSVRPTPKLNFVTTYHPENPKVPVYMREECPLPGWRKVVVVKSGSRNLCGLPWPHYVAPTGEQLCSIRDILEYYKRQGHGEPSNIAALFHFSPVFCLCHHSKRGFYIECVMGVAGCGGLFHPECAGWEKWELEYERKKYDGVVCPLCTQHMERYPEVEKRFIASIDFRNRSGYSTGSVANQSVFRRYLRLTNEGHYYVTSGSNHTTSSFPATAVGCDLTRKESPLLFHSCGKYAHTFSQPHEDWGFVRFNDPQLCSNSSKSHQDLSETKLFAPGRDENQILSSFQESTRHRSNTSDPAPINMLPALDSSCKGSESTNRKNTNVSNDTPSNVPQILTTYTGNISPLAGLSTSNNTHKGHDNCPNNLSVHNTAVNALIPWVVTEKVDALTEEEFEEDIRVATRTTPSARRYVKVIVQAGWKKLLSVDAIHADLRRRHSTENADLIDVKLKFGLINVANKKLKSVRSSDDTRQPVFARLPFNDGGVALTTIFPGKVRLLCEYHDTHCAHCFDRVRIEEAHRRYSYIGSGTDIGVVNDCDEGHLSHLRTDCSLSGSCCSTVPPAARMNTDINGVVVADIGGMKYQLHQHCAEIIRGNYLQAMVSKHSRYRDAIKVRELWESSLKSCDLCGRLGGVVYTFDILKSPPSDSYLKCLIGHPLCILWLARSGVLYTPLLVAEYSMGFDSTGVSRSSMRIGDCNSNDGLDIPSVSSVFDNRFNKYKCSLCGNHIGLTIKCADPTCVVIAHHLCAYMAPIDEKWFVSTDSALLYCPGHIPNFLR